MGYGHRGARHIDVRARVERRASSSRHAQPLCSARNSRLRRARPTRRTRRPRCATVVARAADENRASAAASFGRTRAASRPSSSLLIRDTLGREHTGADRAVRDEREWTRDGRYDLHVVGYRSQSVGVPYSALSIVRGWTVPSLYGDRLSMGAYFNAASRRGDTLIAVHPFARGSRPVLSLLRRRHGHRAARRARGAFRSRAFTSIPSFHGRDAPRRVRRRDRSRRRPCADRANARADSSSLGGPRASETRCCARRPESSRVAYVEFVNAEVDGQVLAAGVPAHGVSGELSRCSVRRVRSFDSSRTSGTSPSPIRPCVAADSTYPPRVDRDVGRRRTASSRFGAWRTRPRNAERRRSLRRFRRPRARRLARRRAAAASTCSPNSTERILRFNRVEGAVHRRRAVGRFSRSSRRG